MRKKQETIHDYDIMRRTTCGNCPTGCGMKIFLKQGRIVDIWGDEEHPINKGSLCPKGLLAAWHLSNPKRTVYPLLRESLNQSFQRTSWDHAVSFIAEKLGKIALNYGRESIVICGDDSCPFGYMAAGTLFARHFGTENSPLRFLPHPFGDDGIIKKVFGIPGAETLMNSPRDWCNSSCILIYGSDLAASDPITFGHIIDARDRGTTLLVIDSKKTITASKATFALRIKPGTGPAVLKGILNFLLRSGLVDEEFLAESTVGYPSLASELGRFTTEKTAECAQVAESDIKKIAGLIGKVKPVQVIAGDWNSRRYLTDEELFLCSAIVSLRGSIGIPGGGLNLLDVSPFSMEERFPWGRLPMAKKPPSHLSLENVLLDSTKTVGTLFLFGNPCARLAEGNTIKRLLRDIPLIVNFSSYPNETFHYCHVSIPMSTWLEYSGLIVNSNGRALQWHHKVVEPPGDCRSPFDFWSDLAGACNLDECLPWKGEDGLLDVKKAADFLLRYNPLTKAATVEKLDPENNPPGGLLWPCVEKEDLEFEESRFVRGNVRGRNILFQRGRSSSGDARFPTPSGKVILSVPVKAERGIASDIRCNNGPSRRAVAAKEQSFPLLLITGVLVDFVEEYGYFVSDRHLRTKNLAVKINPRLGKLVGLTNGQDLTVENDKGSLTAPVWLSDDVDYGVVWCPEGIDPHQPHFGYESPQSLFEVPEKGGVAERFTRVTIYKPGQDRAEISRKIGIFLGNSARRAGSITK